MGMEILSFVDIEDSIHLLMVYLGILPCGEQAQFQLVTL